MVIIHIYGARAIFLLFFDHQDSESERQYVVIFVAVPISTSKNISKAPWDDNIDTLQGVRKIFRKLSVFCR